MSIRAQFVSEDYLGLGLGARWVYDYEHLHESTKWTGRAIEEVIERFDHYGMRTYRLQASTDLHESDPPSGFFRGRSGDTHYEFGSWSGDPSISSSEFWHDTPRIMETKPVHVGDAGFTDMEAARQESVTVKEGTHEAWVFHREQVMWDGRSVETDMWFVPYVGVVKSHEEIKGKDPDTG